MQITIAVTLKEELNGSTRELSFSGNVRDEDGERAEDVASRLMRQFFEESASSGQ